MTTPKKEVDYESRAHRMISRWAGVRGKVRTDEERKVTEIFTDRYENGTEPEEYIIGISSIYFSKLNLFSRDLYFIL